jgi:hypothetical protein
MAQLCFMLIALGVIHQIRPSVIKPPDKEKMNHTYADLVEMVSSNNGFVAATNL